MNNLEDCTNEIISEYANDVNSCLMDSSICDECTTDNFTDSTDHITEVLKNLAGKVQEPSEYECDTPSDDDSDNDTDDQMDPLNKDVLKVVSEMRVDMLQTFELMEKLNKEITCLKKAVKSIGCGTGRMRDRVASLECSSDYSDTINDGLVKIQDEFETKMDLMKQEIEERVYELMGGLERVNKARIAGHNANSKTTPIVKNTQTIVKVTRNVGKIGTGYFQ